MRKAKVLPIIDEESVSAELDEIEAWLCEDEDKAARLSGVDQVTTDSVEKGGSANKQSKGKAKALPSRSTLMVDAAAVDIFESDKSGMIGESLPIHNSLWPTDNDTAWDPTQSTMCTVVGACVEPFAFQSGKPAKAYIVDRCASGALTFCALVCVPIYAHRDNDARRYDGNMPCKHTRRNAKAPLSFRYRLNGQSTRWQPCDADGRLPIQRRTLHVHFGRACKLWLLLGDFVRSVPPPQRRKDVLTGHIESSQD